MSGFGISISIWNMAEVCASHLRSYLPNFNSTWKLWRTLSWLRGFFAIYYDKISYNFLKHDPWFYLSWCQHLDDFIRLISNNAQTQHEHRQHACPHIYHAGVHKHEDTGSTRPRPTDRRQHSAQTSPESLTCSRNRKAELRWATLEWRHKYTAVAEILISP